MPIYEYRCDACSHEIEKLQKVSEAMLVDCPQCEQPALKRLVSAPSFRLKGSGWYETDFKKDNKRNLADAPGKDGDDKKPAATGSETKPVNGSSTSKPDTKVAAKSAADT